jgi:YHS domain-containing protein
LNTSSANWDIDVTGGEGLAKDVVCGMEVNEKTAKFKSEYKGKTYYFCNGFCKETFDANPVEYAGGKTK